MESAPDALNPQSALHEADLARGMEHLRPYVSVSTVNNLPAQAVRRAPSPSLSPTSRDNQTSDLPSEDTTYGIPSDLIKPHRNIPQRPQDPDTNPEKRRDPNQFGSRYLEQGDDIFEFNAWDDVEVDDGFRSFAEEMYQRQREAPVSDFDKGKSPCPEPYHRAPADETDQVCARLDRINNDPARPWNTFYRHNTSNFFKNRNWLFHEFPLLSTATSPSAAPATILEIGAGAGNTAFPLLKANRNAGLVVHAVDFSPTAVNVLRTSPDYQLHHQAGRLHVGTWDLASPSALPPDVAPRSIDIAILIFTFSALAPDQWNPAVRNVWEVLKPGGVVLFRDYARGDLAQVRFKKGRWMGENWYVRGDGTRVYFFDGEEVARIWGGGRNSTVSHGGGGGEQEGIKDAPPRFQIEHVGNDNRLLVNRHRKLKMYRCWLQGRFRKPPLDTTDVADASSEEFSERDPEQGDGASPMLAE